MSNAWLTWAFEYEGLSHGEKSVLVALADHADESGFCYPSQERLALYTGLTERSITRNARALEDRGLISKGKRRHDGGTFQSNTYTLHEAPLSKPNNQPEDNLTAGHNVTSPEDINDTHHRTQCPTNPQYKPPIEPSDNRYEPTKNKRSVPDRFPDQQALEAAQRYWRERGRDDLDACEEAEAFRDNHVAKGNTFKDWGAAWRTWYRNTLKFTKPPPAARAGPKPEWDRSDEVSSALKQLNDELTEEENGDQVRSSVLAH